MMGKRLWRCLAPAGERERDREREKVASVQVLLGSCVQHYSIPIRHGWNIYKSQRPLTLAQSSRDPHKSMHGRRVLSHAHQGRKGGASNEQRVSRCGSKSNPLPASFLPSCPQETKATDL